MMKKQEALFAEVRTLLNTLQTWGNILVPPIEGQTETTAQEKLQYVVDKLQTEHKFTMEEIESNIKNQ